jgi:hypothetical protein
MTIIKEFTPRSEDIQTLKTILELKQLTPSQRHKIQLELYKLQQGDQAEKQAGFYLQKRFADRKDWIILNGLRLEIDGEIAQIDHIGISQFGVVYLFETKSFSTGIKVTEKGDFFRWDQASRQYVEIPSPIQQSIFHENTLRKAFKKLSFEPSQVAHFVLIDYKAKLIKPEKGFENVCRPDRLEDAINAHKDLGFMGVGKVLFKMANDAIKGKTFTSLHLRMLGEKLIQMNTPITFDYHKKFGIDAPAVLTEAPDRATKQVGDSGNGTPDEYNKLTLSKFAQKMGMSKTELENSLVKGGFIERENDLFYLTPKGKQAELEWRKGRFGPYFLIPIDFKFNE